MDELLETKPILITHAQLIAVCKYYAKKHRYHELCIDFERDAALVLFLLRFTLPKLQCLKLTIHRICDPVTLFIK